MTEQSNVRFCGPGFVCLSIRGMWIADGGTEENDRAVETSVVLLDVGAAEGSIGPALRRFGSGCRLRQVSRGARLSAETSKCRISPGVDDWGSHLDHEGLPESQQGVA